MLSDALSCSELPIFTWCLSAQGFDGKNYLKNAVVGNIMGIYWEYLYLGICIYIYTYMYMIDNGLDAPFNQSAC